ncbi:MAG: hypothetical protein R3C09_25600 [Pirellulaceae bacterium]
MSKLRQTAERIAKGVVNTSVLATVSAVLLASAGRAEEIQWLRSAAQAGELAARKRQTNPGLHSLSQLPLLRLDAEQRLARSDHGGHGHA